MNTTHATAGKTYLLAQALVLILVASGAVDWDSQAQATIVVALEIVLNVVGGVALSHWAVKKVAAKNDNTITDVPASSGEQSTP